MRRVQFCRLFAYLFLVIPHTLASTAKSNPLTRARRPSVRRSTALSRLL